ncbi:hypothetical protein RhiJN_27552 [Ceratobasidium sp. AG-Ba]|nr:hypothetical protein RhiJN_27552 [Ceratobasidium sp. AG-Ba]
MSPSQRAALSIDASSTTCPARPPPPVRQKCQEAHTRETRVTTARSEAHSVAMPWSSFSAPPPLPAIHHSPHHYHPPPPRLFPSPTRPDTPACSTFLRRQSARFVRRIPR